MTDSSSSDAGFGTSPHAHDPFQAAKASAMKAAEELRAAAAQKAQEFRSVAENRATQFKATAEQKASELRERAEDLRHYADDAVAAARERYDDIRVEAERITREKPLQALLTAFGAGLFLGLLLRK